MDEHERRLWSLLGIDFDAEQVVWQDYNPYPGLTQLPKEFVFVDTGSGAKQPFNASDAISAGMQHMLFPFPGFLTKQQASTLEFTPLVRTGDVTGTVPYGEILQATPFGRGGLNAERRQVLTGVPYTLAAHVRGTIEPTGGAPPAELDVVLVTDIDMLHQSFFHLREQGATPEAAVHLDFDNVTFVLNALDALAGDERFLAIRRRRGKHPLLDRSPEQIAADRKAAEIRQRIQGEYHEAVQRERDALDKRIEELKDSTRENTKLVEIMANTFLKGRPDAKDPGRMNAGAHEEAGDAPPPSGRGLFSRLFGGGGKS